ncbi:UDP-N-acetylmuramoyl-L-alanine--D-glutamate ligase [Colwellia sp. D2M02]|uniref:UDP-N-acetylmuramoyl-L-alanine--D-glutamate ligase n=1 Tax=Colwellia sp. D2M02 TaxID=2841562 RepID=UPI001C0A2B13|nr:UDP-N-acetylmuramoyl-L-alanine--D-glutamate ligase [Colwellia sp. D2M02]MBU2894839.1 UDP-N-acetylmuramoyl-L-alanine--D-glutamate ligase [Colwellia sp. D2M02]
MSVITAMKNKQVLVLGLGLTGVSCVRFLHKHGLSFAVNDSREMPFSDKAQQQAFINEFINPQVSNENQPVVSLHTGSWQQTLIANADIIIVSPGIDLDKSGINELISSSCQVIGDVELFCQLNNEQAQPIKILAVTGSNGKSTVVSLLAHLAEALGVNAQLGGNIGQPVLDLLSLNEQKSESNHPELLILELSSFQLETLKSMRAIAATVLNVSDDHLDRHLTLANYQEIKQRIYQQSHYNIINRNDAATYTLAANLPALSQSISFGRDKPKEGHFGVDFIGVNNTATLMFGEQQLIEVAKLPLAGMHNAMNYLAALALGYSAGWSLTAMIEQLPNFSGLAHRCQRVHSIDGIQWINDSKATNVGATLAAIDGLSQTLNLASQQLILIAGGDGKGADFSVLKPLLTQQVSQLITFGKDGDKIAALVDNTIQVNNLAEALTRAKAIAKKGDMVLLSPACASIDMFKNFVERGNQFMHLVQVSQPTEVCDVNR